MKILKVNRINLAYDSFGDEVAGVVLLIAGLGTQMIRWTVPFCQNLAALGYRVIRFDNRDVGCSTHDRANIGKRASRAGSIADLYYVEHRESDSASGSVGPDGDDDAPRP